MNMIEKSRQVIGWGSASENGITKLADESPIFSSSQIGFFDKVNLIFHPKKFLLYNWIRKAILEKKKESNKNGKFSKLKILDIGCGTGASIIEMKKLWGKEIEVYGVDNVNLQVELAHKKIKEYGVWSEIAYYDGNLLPFKNDFFDLVYSFDELTRFSDTYNWLEELSRVLMPSGSVALYSNSKIGKNSYLASSLQKQGIHIANTSNLYSKNELEGLFDKNSLEVKKMYTTFNASFFDRPETFYDVLQKQTGFLLLKNINKMLYLQKQNSFPLFTKIISFFEFIKIMTLGKTLETQGYVILAKKKK